VAACDLFGTALPDPDQYAREMAVEAELLGTPSEIIPRNAADLAAYIDRTRADLRLTAAAAESSAYLLNPPGLDEDIADLWEDIHDAVLISLPDWALVMYGLDKPPVTAGTRGEIRGVLGLLDTLFLGEPGILEARQRITLRARNAA
jgi:uncharacterized protein (DUF2236 family)